MTTSPVEGRSPVKERSPVKGRSPMTSGPVKGAVR